MYKTIRDEQYLQQHVIRDTFMLSEILSAPGLSWSGPFRGMRWKVGRARLSLLGLSFREGGYHHGVRCVWKHLLQTLPCNSGCISRFQGKEVPS